MPLREPDQRFPLINRRLENLEKSVDRIVRRLNAVESADDLRSEKPPSGRDVPRRRGSFERRALK